MYRQHVYDLEKRRGDCLMKWLTMLGFINLRWPRVCRCWTSVLFLCEFRRGLSFTLSCSNLGPCLEMTSIRIWLHESWPTLVQVKAWCLMAPSHYLNLCWLFITSLRGSVLTCILRFLWYLWINPSAWDILSMLRNYIYKANIYWHFFNKDYTNICVWNIIPPMQ